MVSFPSQKVVDVRRDGVWNVTGSTMKHTVAYKIARVNIFTLK